MGYESKLYIVDKASMFPNEEMRYCQVIAVFDLCKFYPLSCVISTYPQTDCYFYADDGNTKVLEDRYGDALRELPIEDVIDIIRNEIYSGRTYRRLYPVLAALEVLENKQDQWNELAVLHYGY